MRIGSLSLLSSIFFIEKVARKRSGSSYLFVATTDPYQLGYAFMQAGLPYGYGFMFITALRFIPVFYQDLAQVKNAQLAKGIQLEGVSPKTMVKSIEYLLVPLAISSHSKIDTLTVSMDGRAFVLYEKRTYRVSQNLSRRDKMIIATFSLLFLLLYFTLQ